MLSFTLRFLHFATNTIMICYGAKNYLLFAITTDLPYLVTLFRVVGVCGIILIVINFILYIKGDR